MVISGKPPGPPRTHWPETRWRERGAPLPGALRRLFPALAIVIFGAMAIVAVKLNASVAPARGSLSTATEALFGVIGMAVALGMGLIAVAVMRDLRARRRERAAAARTPEPPGRQGR